MADGSVKIEVGLNIGKAEKDLAKLRDKINKAEDALNNESNKRTGIEQQVAAANAQLDEAKRKAVEVQVELQKESAAADAKLDKAKATVNDIRTEMAGARGSAKAEIRERLNSAMEDQRMYQAEADRLAKEAAKATEELTTGTKEVRETQKEIDKLNKELDKTNAKINQGEKNLTEMKEEAGQLTQQIERARPGEAIANSLESAKRSLTRFLKYAIGIRSVYILFQRLKQAIKSAVQQYAEYDHELKYNLALLSATKKAIQITNGAAFASVFNAILPIVQRIANWMLEAANAASRFIAILSGKSSYKRAVVNAEEVAASLEEAEDDTEDTADAADDVADGFKEAKKQVLGFDELNILESDKDDEKTAKDPKEKIKEAENAALDGIDIIEESIDGLDESFLDKLALTMKDVLFDWHDLNPEQIAEKFIAGLGALLGAALGIALGMGPGGVLLMTLGGLMLGLVADSLIFDHDGKLDKEEILSMVLMALGGLAGGVLGFKAGGFKGAMIGVWIGAGLGLLISQLLFDRDGRLSRTEILDSLLTIINGIVGGVLGFTVGGVKGAMIGAAVGVGATLLFKFFDMKTKGKFTNLKSGIVTMITSVLTGYAGLKIGAAVGGTVGGPIGAIIGIVAGIGLTMLVESIRVSMAARDAFYDTEFGQSVQELKDSIQKTLETSEDLIVHINSITGEVDESTLVDLQAAQGLIDEIFTLDAEAKKTPETIARIKADIEALNGMGLPGVFLSFNDATNEVNGTHDALQLVLDDLLKQYRLEAMKDAYIEALKAQTQAELAKVDALNEGEKAIEAHNKALEEQQRAYEALERAREEYNTNAGYGDTNEKLQEAKDALAAAEEGVRSTREAAEEASRAIDTSSAAIDTAGQKVDIIAEKYTAMVGGAEEVAKEIPLGAKKGYESTEGELASEITRSQEEIQADLVSIWDTHSPSKVTEEMGENIVAGFEEGVKKTAPNLKTQIHSMFADIINEMSDNIQRMKELFNFTWSIPRPKIPKINWTIKNVSYGNGQSVSIPEFFVNWYARGGVFDFPQLIGVGEAGKEAVVPLERNTEWMDMVADGLMERFERANFANDLADAFTKLPKPAMAGGGIVPPNALGAGFSSEDMMDAVRRGVYEAMRAMGSGSGSRSSGGFVININGREFARATYDDYKAVQNEHGVSLIST